MYFDDELILLPGKRVYFFLACFAGSYNLEKRDGFGKQANLASEVTI